MRRILGLDIGGAHLKAACLDQTAQTVAFPLWKHPERLGTELQRLSAAMPAHDELAVTMTAELCDCFASKRQGVQAILASVRELAGARPLSIWSLHGSFLTWDEAQADPLSAAAANWLALSHLVARRFPSESVLLIDTGSSTTDLVYLTHGKPEPAGFTDFDRLANFELVYTGVRRTPLCAVLGMEVAAEWFATMQDAYVFLQLLPEDPNRCDTADGRPLTRVHAHARLARMLCADVDTFSADQACALAEHALHAQWRTVGRAVENVLRSRPPVQRIVLSGSGEVLGQSVCRRHAGLARIPRTCLSEMLGPPLSEAACAYAVAVLAEEMPTHVTLTRGDACGERVGRTLDGGEGWRQPV